VLSHGSLGSTFRGLEEFVEMSNISKRGSTTKA